MKLRLIDLPEFHPNLLWEPIIAAAAAVFAQNDWENGPQIAWSWEVIPSFGDKTSIIRIHVGEIDPSAIAKVQRTFEQHRLIELTAIALAGLTLAVGGQHEIRDVALRGTSADYLVGDSGYLLEIAGRSRKADFGSAWEIRREKLDRMLSQGYFLCVVEFESPSGRLAFFGRE